MSPNVRNLVRKPTVVLPVVAVVAVGGWFGYRSTTSSSATATATERVVAVTSGTMTQTVASSGTIEPETTSDLSFTVSGKVTSVEVKTGQAVKKGQVLATIDSASLASDVAQAQATVDSANAKVVSDTAAGASAAQLAADEATLTSAQAALASAQTSLDGATLSSPIDGTVSALNLTVGQQLGSSGGSANSISGSGSGGANTPAADSSNGNGNNGSSSSSTGSTAQVEVVSTATYVVNLSLDSTQIDNVRKGATATVTPTGSTTDSATGEVTSVSTVATTTSGVASFPVVVTVGGSPAGFYGGATASVAIVYHQVVDALSVPLLAVGNTNGQPTVTVVSGTRRTVTPVTTGIQADGTIQITNGLSAGQQVVVTVPTFSRAGVTRSGNGGEGGTNGPNFQFGPGTGQFPTNGQGPPGGFVKDGSSGQGN